MRAFILTAMVIALAGTTTVAQSSLYVSLSNSKGYVVGAKLQESGLFRYAEDTSWVHIGWNHPFIAGVAYGDSSGTWHLAGGNGEIRSADGGTSWKITTDWRVTESQHIAIDHFDPKLVYLATAYGIWRSMDDGMAWSESSRGLVERYTQAIVADRVSERRVLAATDAGVYASTDAGATWQLFGPGTAMVDIGQSAAGPERWIAGARSGSVYLSNDRGMTWTMTTGAESEVTGVAADPTDSDRFAFVTYGSGAHLTEDGGQSWRSIGEGLPTSTLLEVIFDPSVGGRLWVATKEEGIFYSDDSGAAWTYVGMTGTMVMDMVFVEH